MTENQELLDLAQKVLDDLTTRGLTLAIAESCTGGLASSVLTDFDGSSDVLLYSIVAYTSEAKEEFLGIPSYVLRDFGTISIECAKLMAEGVLEYDADIGLATTGVIGESIEDKLKGTVFIAVAVAGQKTFAKELVLDPKKSRHELKVEIVIDLFNSLFTAIESVY
ncbi:MAG: CinA family protein [Candidatus Heimdallarchaeota archaeon]|nr:CinA family protein [Candidatus Heimdallarchaeota archaeon]MBY8993459.1 CinA family protein [Candidatus Heimdallarchaeota archaeon]